uniref:protein disulfide-isomerase n=1 Tax=Oryzias latipes TaxID=8090 RepID=A0A3P9HR11_ORYLA
CAVVLLSVLLSLLLLQGSAFVEELDDSSSTLNIVRVMTVFPVLGVLLSVQFYAPWCSFCKQLDPVWHEIGSELRSLGSMVQVGKSDATVSTVMAENWWSKYCLPCFAHRLKKNTKYNYAGPRTKEGIMDFANRMEGPVVRSLSSPQLFQHAMSHHNVMFVYVGATSELKGNFTTVAEELIIHTYFFSTTRDVLPKSVSLDYLPAIVVFKDRTYLTYDEESDGDLKAWINRERFLNFQHIDSYTLYAMGESGKPSNPVSSVMSSSIVVLSNVLFVLLTGDYINGFVMGEVTVPSLIVVNLSNDGYYQPAGPVETERQLLDFLDGVLDSTIEGGNGFSQRVQRVIYETKAAVIVSDIIKSLLVVCVWLTSCPLNQTIPDDDEDTAALLATSSEGKNNADPPLQVRTKLVLTTAEVTELPHKFQSAAKKATFVLYLIQQNSNLSTDPCMKNKGF